MQRAFDAVQDTYADRGAGGLARANAECAAALKADARVLDYCLAFNMFATAVAPEIAPADAEAARLAQAKAALPPGADPAARVSQVRALMRSASLGASPAPREPKTALPPTRVAKAAPQRKPASARRVGGGAEERRMAEARAAIEALFARAEARDAAAEAQARPADDGTAPH